MMYGAVFELLLPIDVRVSSESEKTVTSPLYSVSARCLIAVVIAAASIVKVDSLSDNLYLAL